MITAASPNVTAPEALSKLLQKIVPGGA